MSKSWVSYTENVEDGSSPVDSSHIMSMFKTISNPAEFESVASVMIEFADGSFIRFEIEGK